MLESEVLGHSKRKMIFEQIVDNPGITFQMLRTVLKINEGTLKYHLDCLRKNEMIYVKKRKNERVYIPKNVGGPVNKKDLGKEQTRVMRVIRDHPGSDIKEIATFSRSSKNDVKKVLTSLRRKNLIQCRNESGKYVYHPSDDEDLYKEIMLVLMKRYQNGEITLKRLLELKKKLGR